MRIAVIGTGYVGLVTGACFAQIGHTVTCIDVDAEKIANLQSGIIPIYEPGLENLVKDKLAEKKLFFTTDYSLGVSNADLCFIAVPTPSQDDGSCDISYVASAVRSIAEAMNEPKIIAIKSTVPVGTCHQIYRWIDEVLLERGVAFSFSVVSNPEFLREGTAIYDCLNPDRILIGSDSPHAIGIMKELYTPLNLKDEKILVTDSRSAEMTKFAANAMLATRISFMNELSEICKGTGANIEEVRKGIGSDSRIGEDFLFAGVGFGGSCFPKDLRALISIGKEVGSGTSILQAVCEVNLLQKKWLGYQIEDYFKDLLGKTIAIWGLAFKPNTDDIREAPALDVIEHLLRRGAQVRIFDPVAMKKGKEFFTGESNITWCLDELDAADGSDAIALITEWNQFQLVDFKTVKIKMNGSAFFDGRNQFEPISMEHYGFDYICVGMQTKTRI